MAREPLLWLQITCAALSLCSAIFAGVCWRRVSAFSSQVKRLAGIELKITELDSAFSDVMENWKRLRSREGMRELRAARRSTRDDGPPPIGAPKAELRRYYGLERANPAHIAARQAAEGE